MTFWTNVLFSVGLRFVPRHVFAPVLLRISSLVLVFQKRSDVDTGNHRPRRKTSPWGNSDHRRPRQQRLRYAYPRAIGVSNEMLDELVHGSLPQSTSIFAA